MIAATDSIYSSLAKHMMGNAKPSSDELFKIAKDVYFDYVASSDAQSADDFKDIAGALIRLFVTPNATVAAASKPITPS